MNLTSRCPTACVFCIKRAWKWRFHNEDLRLSKDPSARAVWAAATDLATARSFTELVFCGYGESTYRLPELLALSASAHARFPGMRRRLNTIGLGNLIWGRDITPQLGGALDAVSVSLNTANPGEWVRLHAPRRAYASDGFSSVLRFIRGCVERGLDTTVTAVEGLGADLKAVEALAASVGARFRLRAALTKQNGLSRPKLRCVSFSRADGSYPIFRRSHTMEQGTLHRTIGRSLDKPLSTFDITKALADLRAEPAIGKEGRNAIILHKEGGLKVVLIAMRAGNEIRSHKAPGPITVQIIEGAIRFKTGKETRELKAGELLTLHASVLHDLTALEDAAFLLTLAGDTTNK